MHLIPSLPLVEIAKVLSHGAGKYGTYNWAEGMGYNRLAGSLGRHWLAWKEGEDLDGESKLNHLAHIACNAIFLLAYQLYGLGTDDRWKPGRKEETTAEPEEGPVSLF